EGKRSVGGVPPGRREAGAEIDKRITRQSLFPESPGDREHLLLAGQRPVRLLIPQCTQRRNLRSDRQSRVFCNHLRRLVRDNDEYVQTALLTFPVGDSA